MITATGAYCANEQGKYWDYAHWIYNNQDGENQGGFSTERVTQIAVAAGVEEQAFTTLPRQRGGADARRVRRRRRPSAWASTRRPRSTSAASRSSGSRARPSCAR